MASMIFASSPLSVQSFVKLRTNSNYSHSPCYVSMAKNSYLHLPYKNISNIQSSKSLFTKGDGNFSFSSPKFPRVASKYSPSLNIIKAISESESVYHFYAHDVKTRKDFQLGRKYWGEILLIVNLPQKISSGNTIREIKFLNDLRKRYKDKTSSYGGGFEVLGFFPCMEETKGEENHEEEIQKLVDFPIFRKGNPNDDNDCNFWNFLRKGNETMEEEFEKYLVDGTGKCINNFPWFEEETLKPGKSLGDKSRPRFGEDPHYRPEVKDSKDPKSGGCPDNGFIPGGCPDNGFIPGGCPGNESISGGYPGNRSIPGLGDPRYQLEDTIASYFQMEDNTKN